MLTPPLVCDPPDNPHGRLAPAKMQQQYEVSRKALRTLYSNQVPSITATWKSVLYNGHVHEIICTSYVNESEQILGPDGIKQWRPKYVTFTCSMAYTVKS